MAGMTDREFWLMVRQALLMFIEAIERKWIIYPRTSELRKLARGQCSDVPIEFTKSA